MKCDFEKVKEAIEKKYSRNLNTGYFDKLLLNGGYIQDIHEKMKNRGYGRFGFFISDRTFWGHIGVRIKDDDFVFIINGNDILKYSSSKENLTDLYNSNCYIKLIGCGNDIETDDFGLKVIKSLSDSPENRAKRLKLAPKIPKKIMGSTLSFSRNPDVVAEVLERANGICEYCKKPAPFQRKSNAEPYLEVHHTIFLSKGGEDTVENAEALCPNCHRYKHFGC